MNEPMVLREWRKFAAEVLDPVAGPVQRAEMQMAWGTGAHVVLTHLAHAPNANLRGSGLASSSRRARPPWTLKAGRARNERKGV